MQYFGVASRAAYGLLHGRSAEEETQPSHKLMHNIEPRDMADNYSWERFVIESQRYEFNSSELSIMCDVRVPRDDPMSLKLLRSWSGELWHHRLQSLVFLQKQFVLLLKLTERHHDLSRRIHLPLRRASSRCHPASVASARCTGV